MIHPDTVELIIDKARVEEVISDFISLKKSGSNYKGCCPFHDEKTPSFMVSPAKGIYKCFGCGKGGNAVNFIMDHERLSYVDSLKYLAKKYHIEVVETKVSEEDIQKKDVRESLQVINTYATDYFIKKLHESNEGKAIGLSYFKERGFTDETIKKFQLGYSPDQKDAFTQEALKQGYKLEFLEKTGLTVTGENNNGDAYQVDRFRGRVMFPVQNLSGNVIGFGGRIVGNDPEKKLAKYLNSPESEIYNKSKTLYGIYFARTVIAKKDECILVEGYTDVMSMHQSGIENVVASSGTSLTVEQIQLIKRFTNNILVIYDGDSAGIKASFRGINMILEHGLNVKVLLLPDGDDPDSFAKKHSSQELLGYINQNKSDFIAFKTKLFADESKNDPIERAKLINDIVHSIAIIPDKITQTVYVAECSKILKISESILLEQIQKLTLVKNAKETGRPIPQEIKKVTNQVTETELHQNPLYHNERDILRLLIDYGNEIVDVPLQSISVKDYINKEIVEDELTFNDDLLRLIFDEYYIIAQDNLDAKKILLNHQNRNITDVIVSLMMNEYEVLSKIWSKNENVIPTELDKLPILLVETIGEYKKRRLDIDLKAWNERLKTSSPEEQMAILETTRKLKKAISNLAKELKHVS
jgi:DNA primase